MFERFNDKAIKTIILAQEEARRWGHTAVSTEHVLLGILAEKTSVAAKVLDELGVSLKIARRVIENATGLGPGMDSPNIPFTPRVKSIFEQSFVEARQFNSNFIAPEYILLAIARERDSLAAKVLMSQDIDLDLLRNEIIKKLGEQQTVAVAAKENRFKANNFNNKSNILAEFSTNLTAAAAAGKLDPVIGRNKEVERTIQILGRRTKNNPVLVGEPGVGKTAIAEGLAQRIVDGEVPPQLQDKQVISLDLGLLLAGTKMRGEFEERIKNVIEEVRQAGNIILAIDELHTLIGAGGLGGSLDAANMLKPALARGELQCLGTTTLDEYCQYIETDAALERRFQKVMVDEPSVEDTIAILQGLRKTYEEYHKVKISDRAIEAAARLSDRYIADRFLPDKAIDLIDEAGSRVHLRHSLEKGFGERLEASQIPVVNPQALTPVVDEEEIAQIVAAWTGVPVNKIGAKEANVLLDLEAQLHQRVIGQEDAVQAVARAIRRSRSGIKDPHRPIASLIFAGPTGVGKTELAKALAATVFGSSEAIVRLDMSELMESHTVSKLIGSPPGYVGYEEGGQLTEAVRRKPYTVVLFDEIEKAHPDIFNLLLQLLDDGHLTDARGRKVDFKNTLIIMTSNIGSKVIEKGGSGLGFATEENEREAKYNRVRNLVNQELKQYFRPEFINRLDDIIVFHQLVKSEVKQIAEILLAKIANQIKEVRGIDLEVTERFKDKVVVEGFNPSYGARPLRRAITQLLEDSLAEAILSNSIQYGDRVLVDVNDLDRVIVESSFQPVLELQAVG